MSTIPESHRDILDKNGFAHVASIGPDGEPQSHPVWYDHDGDRITISTTRDRQKLRNMERDGRVSLTIQDPDDPYRYVEVRAHVSSVKDDQDNTFIDSLSQDYLGESTYPGHQPGDERVIITFEPDKINTMG